jgi:hypothetical protein
MRAPDPLPPRRASRAAHRALGLLVAVALGIVVATGLSPAASADPPAGWNGPWLETNRDFGMATDSIKASYWYVDSDDCYWAIVRFYWDGNQVGSDDTLDSDCHATYSFGDAPTATPGDHILSAIACYVDATSGGEVCDDYTRASLQYSIVTVVLKPTNGRVATDFKATYSTNQSKCTFVTAQFFWDGDPLGAPVDLDASCTAVKSLTSAPKPNGVGTHTLSAQACSPRAGCDTQTTARATYRVRPNPTPTPTPRPTPTVVPTATPTTVPTPSPSPSPSVEPSVLPSPSDAPTPSPSGAVAGETSPPETPAPSQAIVIASEPPGNSYVPALVNDIGGPDAGSIDPEVIATNIFLTLLVLFFFGLTAEIFNSTMDANRDEVHGWWARLLRGPLALLAALNISGTSLGHLSGSGRIGSFARVLLVLSLLGIIYGFLSPDFGWNPQSLILIVSLIVGLGFLTLFSEGSATRLAARRYRADASIKLYGTAIIVAILAVVVSRLVDFSPGLVYGFVASAVIVAPVALARRDDATLILVPAFGVLVVSLLAWLLLGPVRVAAADGSPLPALAETILAMIMIGGLEGLFITMIPLTFLDGATVKNWSRVGWAVVFGIVTFLWWQLLLNQDAAYIGAFEQTNVRVVLATLGVFMLTTGGLWSYFRFRPKQIEAEA